MNTVEEPHFIKKAELARALGVSAKAFLERLEMACQRTGWQIHAFVLTRNHYHVVLHTPEPNLVEGMKWLQNISQQVRRFDKLPLRTLSKELREWKRKIIIVDW